MREHESAPCHVEEEQVEGCGVGGEGGHEEVAQDGETEDGVHCDR